MLTAHRPSWTLVAIIGILCVLIVRLAHSESQTEAPAKPTAKDATGIVLIDVGRIYENHQRFKNAMEKMKLDVMAAENGLKADADRLQAIALAAQSLRGEEQDAKQREFTSRQAELNLKATTMKKDFLEREARIYHQVYQEITEETTKYSKQHGAHLVFRYNSTTGISGASREEILQYINRPIVYSDVPDITDIVLAALNVTPPAPKVDDSKINPADYYRVDPDSSEGKSAPKDQK